MLNYFQVSPIIRNALAVLKPSQVISVLNQLPDRASRYLLKVNREIQIFVDRDADVFVRGESFDNFVEDFAAIASTMDEIAEELLPRLTEALYGRSFGPVDFEEVNVQQGILAKCSKENAHYLLKLSTMVSADATIEKYVFDSIFGELLNNGGAANISDKLVATGSALNAAITAYATVDAKRRIG